MTISKGVGQLIVILAVAIDFYLEIHGKPVPVTIGILVGATLRHLMSDAPVNPPDPIKPIILTMNKPISGDQENVKTSQVTP